MVLTLLSSATLLLLNLEKPDTASHISTWSTLIVTYTVTGSLSTTTQKRLIIVLLFEMAFTFSQDINTNHVIAVSGVQWVGPPGPPVTRASDCMNQ